MDYTTYKKVFAAGFLAMHMQRTRMTDDTAEWEMETYFLRKCREDFPEETYDNLVSSLIDGEKLESQQRHFTNYYDKKLRNE